MASGETVNDEASVTGSCGNRTETPVARRGCGVVAAGAVTAAVRSARARESAERTAAVLGCRLLCAAELDGGSAAAAAEGPESGAAEAMPDPQNTATPTPAANVTPPRKPASCKAPTCSDGSSSDHLTNLDSTG